MKHALWPGDQHSRDSEDVSSLASVALHSVQSINFVAVNIVQFS